MGASATSRGPRAARERRPSRGREDRVARYRRSPSVSVAGAVVGAGSVALRGVLVPRGVPHGRAPRRRRQRARVAFGPRPPLVGVCVRAHRPARGCEEKHLRGRAPGLPPASLVRLRLLLDALHRRRGVPLAASGRRRDRIRAGSTLGAASQVAERARVRLHSNRGGNAFVRTSLRMGARAPKALA